MKLSQLHQQPGAVRVATYTLDPRLAFDLFQRCQERVRILCNDSFDRDARELKVRLPQIKIACCRGMHAKFVLIAPETVYLGSMNIVKNGALHDTMIGLRGEDIFAFYARWFDTRWDRCTPVSGACVGNPFLEFAHENNSRKQKARFSRKLFR